MSFHAGTWQQRFGAMGDEAERVFEEVYPRGFIRYGLDRPPISVGKLPLKIRYTPDYLTTSGLVEVMGCGQDQQLKLKAEKLTALQMWNQDHPVQLFIWDSHHKRYCYADIAHVVHTAHATSEIAQFNDGKPWWALPLESLEVEWQARKS